MAAGDRNVTPQDPCLTAAAQTLTFYPSYCFAASPTYFTWIKLTAYDIHHTLSIQRGFEGENLHFYLNHPVQFVYLVGVVVSYDDFYEKRWVLTIDDSSGATIEVTCPKSKKEGVGVEEDLTGQPLEHGAASLAQQQSGSTSIGSVDVGSVIHVKGTVGYFRAIRQIHLERIAIVPDTNAEIQFWNRRTRYKTDVLSIPWIVSPAEQGRLSRAAESREKDDRVRAYKAESREAAKEAREARHARRIARKYEQEELKRGKAAERARQAAEVLKGGKSGTGCTSSFQKKTANLSKEAMRSRT